jgi:DNA-binding NarL/FixJ family response regulator
VIRVVVADDQTLVRAGFRSILDRQPDVEVVGEAGDGAEAVEVVRRTRPDVVCMDIRMPRLDGIEATRRIAGEARVLILTTFDLDHYVYDALRAGASAFLLKDAPPEQLADAVRTLARGDSLFAPSVVRRLVEAYVTQPAPIADRQDSTLAALTDREVDVLREIAAGRSNAEIATALYLSEATVKTHVTRILAKLGLRDRVQAVVLAYELGVVRPGRRPGAGSRVQGPSERL